MLRRTSLALVVFTSTAVGCTDRPDPVMQARADSVAAARADSIARARQDSINRAQPGYIIDSILPVEEELRRFRADITSHPAALEGGAPSRDSLVHLFVRGLEAADTTALVRMLMNRAEFAWLVYPESPWTHPPYRQSPQLVWTQGRRESETGLTRLLERFGGHALGFDSYYCGSEPEVMGRNTIWRECGVRIERSPGQLTAMRLFAGIVERDGRYKIFSYGNGL